MKPESRGGGGGGGIDAFPLGGTPSRVTVLIGGVDSAAPYATNSLRLDAKPLAADAAFRASRSRVADAERVAAEQRAATVAAERVLEDVRNQLFETRSALEVCRLDALESNAALAKMQRRSVFLETSARREQEDATRAKAREEEARRAANRAVAEARAIAERRVAEAVRDERLRAERKAREARLANAAARRRGEEGALPGSSWGVPPSATSKTPAGLAAGICHAGWIGVPCAPLGAAESGSSGSSP